MTVRELYEFAKKENCLDNQINVLIDDDIYYEPDTIKCSVLTEEDDSENDYIILS